MSFVIEIIVALMEVSTNGENSNCLLTFGMSSSVCLFVLFMAQGVATHYLHKLNWHEISTSQNWCLAYQQIKAGFNTDTSTCTHRNVWLQWQNASSCKVFCSETHTEMFSQPCFLIVFKWKIELDDHQARYGVLVLLKILQKDFAWKL